MFCRKCGSYMKDDARFCEKCGNPVMRQPVQPSGQTPQALANGISNSGKSSVPKALKIGLPVGLGVVAIALVVVLIFVINGNSGGGESSVPMAEQTGASTAEPTQDTSFEDGEDTASKDQPSPTDDVVSGEKGETTPEQLLQDYISGLTFLGDNDTEYDICVDEVKSQDGFVSVSVFVKDLDGDLIGYRVDDFDDDGEDELLTVGMDQEEHVVVLSIHEIKEGEVKLQCEEKCLPNYNEIKGSYVFQTVRLGVFTYSQNKEKYICIEMNSDFPGANSDGFFGGFAYDGDEESCFIRYGYDGNKLQRKGKVYDDGFLMEEDLKESALEYKKFGIDVTWKNVDKILYSGTPVNTFIPDAETVASIVETAVDGMEADKNAMKRAKNGEKIKLGSIVFHNTGK